MVDAGIEEYVLVDRKAGERLAVRESKEAVKMKCVLPAAQYRAVICCDMLL